MCIEIKDIRSRSGTMHLASWLPTNPTYVPLTLLMYLSTTFCISNAFTQHHAPLDNGMRRIEAIRCCHGSSVIVKLISFRVFLSCVVKPQLELFVIGSVLDLTFSVWGGYD